MKKAERRENDEIQEKGEKWKRMWRKMKKIIKGTSKK